MNPQQPIILPNKQSKLPLILVTLLLMVSIGFGIWAFSQMQSYKTKSDAKSAAAVSAAKKTQEAELKQKYDDEAKSPYKVFKGSPTYGTVTFDYPKSWSAYVLSDAQQLINAYFYPGEVPSIESDADFPLRVELLTTDYAASVEQYSSQVAEGDLRATAYIPPKMKNISSVPPGLRLDGSITSGGGTTKQGSIIILKLRDKTLQISSLSQAGVRDLDSIILPSLSFIP
jgi:hypothetical protein